MCEIINSITIKDIETMKIIFEKLKKIFVEKEIELFSLDLINDKTLYYYVKSHRSNVTEGNTTNIGEFTEIVLKRKNGDDGYIVPSKPAGETIEIDNLVKAFEYLEKEKKFNITILQNVHRILGKDIYKSNLDYFRGKLKTGNNYVPFQYNNVKYKKYFVEAYEVKESLNRLFKMFDELSDDSIESIFAKYIILQVELIAIHPFIDGNGRVSRAISESYLESFNFIPYTPYSTKYKKDYQRIMGKYSIEAISNLENAYETIAKYFLDDYINNATDLIGSVNKLQNSI